MQYRLAEFMWTNGRSNVKEINELLEEGWHMEGLFECKDNTVERGRITVILHKGCEELDAPDEDEEWKSEYN